MSFLSIRPFGIWLHIIRKMQSYDRLSLIPTLRQMLIVYTVLLLLVALVNSQNVTGDTELVLAHIVFRHGARTTYSTYPNDPYANETYYPFGWGRLTNVGKMDAYRLGKFLRKYYIDFLGEDYTDEKVSIRSTHFIRTRMSAQLVLAGLFPPSPALMWNPDLMWQPIPVSYKDADVEDLFHTRNCDNKLRVMKEYMNNADRMKPYTQPYRDIFRRVEALSGKRIKHPGDILDLLFILQTQSEMNLTLPEWTNDIFPEPLESIAALTYEVYNIDPDVKKLHYGYLIKKMIDDSESKISNTVESRERKLFLYSGHDTTIGYLLYALFKVRQTKVPAYASALSLELHRKDSDYFIKVRHRTSTNSEEFTDLKLPDCDMLCPFQKFKELHSSILPKLPMNVACRPGHLYSPGSSTSAY